MAEFLSASGPIFGPDFVLVTVNDETGTQYQLEVYPDASNEDLRKAGRPMQYYWQPGRVYLAKKQNSPKDYDFGLTVFKGLMTTETSVGVTDEMTTGGAVEEGGGFCAFTTTFAVPDSVVANALQVLKEANHPAPKPWMAHLFGVPDAGAPDPLLGIVPIVENNVTIEIPNLAAATSGAKAPMYIDAQGAGKGSIEAHGFSSFLLLTGHRGSMIEDFCPGSEVDFPFYVGGGIWFGRSFLLEVQDCVQNARLSRSSSMAPSISTFCC